MRPQGLVRWQFIGQGHVWFLAWCLLRRYLESSSTSLIQASASACSQCTHMQRKIHTHKIKQKVSPWHPYQVFTWGLLIWRHPIIMSVSGPGGFQRNNQNKTQKEATCTWGSKVSSNYKSYLWIYGWTPNCPTQDSRPLSPTCDQRVLSEVTGKNKPEEYGESKHKQVPGRIQINELQVREADGCDHSWREKRENTVPEFTRGWGQAPWCPFSVHQKSAWRAVQCQKGQVQG